MEYRGLQRTGARDVVWNAKVSRRDGMAGMSFFPITSKVITGLGSYHERSSLVWGGGCGASASAKSSL